MLIGGDERVIGTVHVVGPGSELSVDETVASEFDPHVTVGGGGDGRLIIRDGAGDRV